jgi:hypothetical protein
MAGLVPGPQVFCAVGGGLRPAPTNCQRLCEGGPIAGTAQQAAQRAPARRTDGRHLGTVPNQMRLDAFKLALATLRWVESRNLYVEDNPDRFWALTCPNVLALADELIQ